MNGPHSMELQDINSRLALRANKILHWRKYHSPLTFKSIGALYLVTPIALWLPSSILVLPGLSEVLLVSDDRAVPNTEHWRQVQSALL